jgi:hypothetical protein
MQFRDFEVMSVFYSIQILFYSILFFCFVLFCFVLLVCFFWKIGCSNDFWESHSFRSIWVSQRMGCRLSIACRLAPIRSFDRLSVSPIGSSPVNDLD